MAKKPDKFDEYIKIYEDEILQEEAKIRQQCESNLTDKEDNEIDSPDTPESVTAAERLIDSYSAQISQPSGDVHTLRSGKTYPVHTTPASTMATNTVGSPVTAQTLKFLQTENTVRPFTGQDVDYSVYTFMTMCEDVLRHSGTTDDADKIAFVRSKLVPGSRAQRMMEGVSFLSRNLGQNYDLFKEKMLRIFGGGAETTLLKQIISIVESIENGGKVENPWDASIPAGKQMESCLRVLREQGWCEGPNNTIITFENLSKFFEIFFLLFQVHGKARHAFLSLNYTPNDRFDVLVSTAESKLKEGKEGASVAATVTENVPVESYAAVVGRRPLVCSYCNKAGHHEKRCLKRKSDQKKAAVKTGYFTPSAQAPHTGQGKALSTRPKNSISSHTHATFSHTYPHASTSTSPQTPPPHPPSSHPPTSATGRFATTHDQMSTSSSPPPYFCLVHGYGRHSSDRCRQIAQMRAETDARRVAGPQPAGEAARPATKKPG